ncbi:MAG: hypothetical protein ACLFSW_00805 [Halobacteriales archaeon]
MTEKAVKKEFDGYVKSVSLKALDELDPTQVVDVNLPPDRIKSLLRDEIRQEMARVKSGFQEQSDFIVETAANGGATEEDKAKFLELDLYYSNYFGDEERKKQFGDELGEYFEETVENVAPLVASDEEEFWDAVAETYDEDEAVEVLQSYFRRSDILKKYTDEMVLTMALDTGLPIEEVEYTEESVRVFAEGEAEMRGRIEEQANLVYD